MGVFNATSSATVNTYKYDPWGVETSKNETVYNRWRYGQGFADEYNSTSTLMKFGQRYYDSSTMRWTQPDPLGGGYLYAGNNPVNATDPSGLREGVQAYEPCSVCSCVFQGVGALAGGGGGRMGMPVPRPGIAPAPGCCEGGGGLGVLDPIVSAATVVGHAASAVGHFFVHNIYDPVAHFVSNCFVETGRTIAAAAELVGFDTGLALVRALAPAAFTPGGEILEGAALTAFFIIGCSR